MSKIKQKKVFFPKVKIRDVREVDSIDFFNLLDINSRLHDLHSVATKDYVAFYYIDNDRINHIGFIRNNFKCFVGGI